MGKINVHKRHSVQIIPLNQAKKRRGHHPNENRSKMQRLPYMSDSTLVPRVQKYLESNVDKTYVDINVMADDLQRSYREYARLKRNGFRASVKKAYAIVLQSYGLEDQDNSSSDDDQVSDDSMPEGTGFQNNSLSTQLINLYSRPVVPTKRIDENELIDISSDDSEGASPAPVVLAANDKSSSNGPSTSQANRDAVNNQNSGGALQNSSKANTNKLQQQQIKNIQILIGGKKRKLDGGAESLPYAKKKKSLATLQEPSVSFENVGGMDKIYLQLGHILMHMIDPQAYKWFNSTPSTGLLLHGPPGCGKTLLANAIAGQLRIPLLEVMAPELVSGISGESEERIRELFERAACSSPCILFIDEIDVIAANRNHANKDMERRMVAQLVGCLDALMKSPNADRVLVIAATNRPEVIDPALRRIGRFNLEICLGIPDVTGREQILKVITAKCPMMDNLDLKTLAKLTPGFVGADLRSLMDGAIRYAIERIRRVIYEQDKLAKAVAAKKAEKEREKLRKKRKEQQQQKEASAAAAAAAAPAASDKNETIDLNKSDPEIVVEDDVAVAKVIDDEPTPGDSSDGGAILVIDDEPKPSSSSSVGGDAPTSSTGGDGAAATSSTGIANGDAAGTVKADKALIIDDDDDDDDDDGQVVDEDDEDDVLQEPMALDSIKPMSALDSVKAWLQDPPRVREEHRPMHQVRMEDFLEALNDVKPAATREGFAAVPKTTWDEVGSLAEVRLVLQRCILGPIKYAEQYQQLGMSTPAGVLLCGPPGCGKTLVAKAVANEAGINFLSVKGPELLNMYVGQSEEAVRKCFLRAQHSAPCVIFFDEFEALCPKRSDSGEGGVTNRVVNQLLTEMDGAGDRTGVYLLAATNRPEILDPAVLRPGRFDRILYVGIPTASDRLDILRALTKNGTKPPIAPDVNFELIASSDELNGYTGADLGNLVRQAANLALEEHIARGLEQERIVVTNEHFKMAAAQIIPSVSEKDRKHYEKLKKMYTPLSKLNEVEEMELS